LTGARFTDKTQTSEIKSRASVVEEVVMNTFKAIWKKAALAAVTLGGLLAFWWSD
jgi:hypothetical protein